VSAVVAGLASATAAGLARKFTDAQEHAVETGLADVAATAVAALAVVAPARAAALCETVTIDLDTTDVEVYGRKKRGVAFNHQSRRVGRPHVACWADATMVLAADLISGCDDPRGHAAGLLGRALAALPAAARGGRILDGVVEGDWTDAIDVTDAQVAVAEYCPDWWPAATRLLIRRVALDVPAGHVSAGPRARRRRTLHPDQRALPINELAPLTPSTATRSWSPTSTCPPVSGRPRWSTGTDTGPRSRTCSATPSSGPPCDTCPPVGPRSTGRLCGARCSPPASPAGCTSSPQPTRGPGRSATASAGAKP